MNFDELLGEVYTLTARADLVAETKLAVKSATLKYHQSDFFSKDIHETGVEFDTASFRQSLDYISLISNFRSLSYFKRVEDENDSKGKFFEILTPTETLDSYGKSKSDIAYVAGRVIEIRSSVEFSKALFGCYVFPIVTEGNYVSWIAELYPYLLIFEAARVVLKTIGRDTEARAMEVLVAEQFVAFYPSALTDVGS